MPRKFFLFVPWNYVVNYVQKQPPTVFCKKGVFKNFGKFTGKHLCQRLFFNKVTDLTPANLSEKSLWYRYFPMNFAKFLKTPFFTVHLRCLFLYVYLKDILQDFERNRKHLGCIRVDNFTKYIKF